MAKYLHRFQSFGLVVSIHDLVSWLKTPAERSSKHQTLFTKRWQAGWWCMQIFPFCYHRRHTNSSALLASTWEALTAATPAVIKIMGVGSSGTFARRMFFVSLSFFWVCAKGCVFLTSPSPEWRNDRHISSNQNAFMIQNRFNWIASCPTSNETSKLQNWSANYICRW